MANNFIFVRLEYSGGSVPTGWAEYQTGETAVLPGNLNISGNSRRITADFNSADPTAFQEQTANNRTLVYAAPSGTATEAGYVVRNAAALTNCTIGLLRVNATTVSVESNVIGGGTPLPLSLMTAGVIRMQIAAASSEVTFPTAGTRIRGDFASGPGSFANRVIFQGVGNSQTALTAIPSGTGNVTALQLFSSSDPENASRGSINLVSSQELNISASKSGTGTYPPMTFSTSDLERMRIQVGGVIRFNATNDNPISSNTSGTAINTSGYTQMRAPTTVVDFGTAGASTILGFYSGTSAVGSVSTNGTTTAYNTSSDYRLKDDVQPLDPVEATNRVMAYRPVTWTWKIDGSYGKGFIAHECQAVDPMTATGTKDQMEQVGNIVLADGTIAAEDVKEPEDVFTYGEGAEWQMTTERPVYQGRDDSKMIPDMIAMMQRMELRIRELETEVALLKSNTP